MAVYPPTPLPLSYGSVCHHSPPIRRGWEGVCHKSTCLKCDHSFNLRPHPPSGPLYTCTCASVLQLFYCIIYRQCTFCGSAPYAFDRYIEVPRRKSALQPCGALALLEQLEPDPWGAVKLSFCVLPINQYCKCAENK